MSLISFIKEAGEKLFKKPEQSGAGTSTQAAPRQESVEVLDTKAGEAIQAYVEQQNLGIQNLDVKFEGASGKATITGQAPTQEVAEKAVLCCGNVAHVESVDNQLTVAQPAKAAQYHDVAKGDTLSAIAKKYYGDANKYNAIFTANRPMLTHPDKIYPGQKLRIPEAV
jgi:nucleoid-associated protein YgaU